MQKSLSHIVLTEQHQSRARSHFITRSLDLADVNTRKHLFVEKILKTEEIIFMDRMERFFVYDLEL